MFLFRFIILHGIFHTVLLCYPAVKMWLVTLLCSSSDSFPFVAGKMFQAPDLNLIVEFIFMFYKEKPIDWLLDHILWVKVCNPEKDAVCTLITAVLDLTLNVS